MTVTFWERNGAGFPPFKSENKISDINAIEASEKLNTGEVFRLYINDSLFEFNFSEEVHSNGWWAKNLQTGNVARVSFHNGEKFLG